MQFGFVCFNFFLEKRKQEMKQKNKKKNKKMGVHGGGPWTRSKEGVHGPGVHVLSSPRVNVTMRFTAR